MIHDRSLPILTQRHETPNPNTTPTAPTTPTSHPLHTLSRSPNARSLYIHIPFCFHKCHYCDFYSIVDRQDRQAPFTTRLIEELTALAPNGGQLDTIFVGGGTPTLLRPDLWQQLLAALHTLFHITPDTEFTVEANPETITAELAQLLAAGGVNRISVGAQSFNQTHLKTLERWHDPAKVGAAIDLARAAGITRQSLDLIFAIPGQTLEDWAHDLDTGLALGTTHLSAYNLTYEPATAMTARLHKGEFNPTDEDLEIDMLELLVTKTTAAGLDRYEVSNFAAPGHECQHNLAYWRQHDWLAAGPSASAHLAGHRWKNTPNLRTYLADYLATNNAGVPPITDHEPPDPRRALAEKIMTGLRLREGLDRQALLTAANTIDPATHDRLAQAIDTLDTQSLTTSDQTHLRLTHQALLQADGLAATLMHAIDP